MKTIFYSLLLTFLFIALAISVIIGTCKIMGWTCDITRITFSLTFSLVWLYFHKEVETFMKEESEEENKKRHRKIVRNYERKDASMASVSKRD